MSIPLFLIGKIILPENIFLLLLLPGIVLFTFLHFNETPAIVTSVVIGVGIVFCGAAVIHNVFIWQRVGQECCYIGRIVQNFSSRRKPH